VKRTPLKAQSHAQALREARWGGIKDERLFTLGADAKCEICGETFDLDDIVDADHILPRSKGGSYNPDNMQLVHRACHQRKHGVLNWSSR
jgi:5-methylcytosine-specific restriction endonuclease McrA